MILYQIIILLNFFNFLVFAAAASDGHNEGVEHRTSAEHRLFSKMMAPGRYQKSVRPVVDHSQAIKIKIGLAILSIDEIVTKKTLILNSFKIFEKKLP